MAESPTDSANLLSKHRLSFSNAVAALILVKESGHYLVQLRDNVPGIFYPDHWGLFGGAVDGTETPEEALRRELDEELGLIPQQLVYFSDLDFDLSALGHGRCWRRFYETTVTTAQLTGLRLGEGRRMEVVPAQELLTQRRVAPYDSFALWLHFSKRLWTEPETGEAA